VHRGKKITLLHLTPNKIVQCDSAIAETDKRESENQHDRKTPPLSSNAIKLKSRAMLATRSDLVVPPTVDAHFHALVCRQVLFLLDDITTSLPHAITNILQEFKDVFPVRYPRDCHLCEELNIKSTLSRERRCQTVQHIGPIRKRLRKYSDKP
jgi:hypothetical protein